MGKKSKVHQTVIQCVLICKEFELNINEAILKDSPFFLAFISSTFANYLNDT
jgi:hypothetical protein